MIKRFIIQTTADVNEACLIEPSKGELLCAGSCEKVVDFLRGELVDNKA